MRAFTRRLLAAGNPMEWSRADKCLLVAVCVLPFILVYMAFEYYTLRHPEIAPFVDPAFLPRHAEINWGFIAAWTAVAVAALRLRSRTPENTVLVHVTCQLYCGGFAFGSYLIGHYTNNYAAAVFLGGVPMGLLLFDRAPMLLATGTFFAVVLGTTVLEQVGLIPYAPLVSGSPASGGHLSTYFFLAFGFPTFAILVLAFLVMDYTVQGWRDREEQLARANEVISRYVAAQVAEQIRAGHFDDFERLERRKLTLFFSDINSFTEVADLMEPEDVLRLLNEYLAEMTAIAERHGATIDKFIADAIMIFVGAPVATNDRDHALRTVRMALEMQARMGVLAERWRREGVDHPLEMRIGINTGLASVGTLGSKGRMDYTAIGRQVNVAARLQLRCPPRRILVSHSTWLLVRDEIECVPRPDLQAEGVRGAPAAYEVVGPRGATAAAER
jgi:class 3 adenylate cyclase